MNNTPKIRFKGYTDAWEQCKLGDMLDRYEDPVETPHDGYERIGIRSHAKGVFHSYVEPGKELDTAKMHRVAADKFILNITFAWEHAVAITEEEDAGTLVSHRFPQFSFHKELKSHCFKFLMLDRKFREYLELCSPGGAGRNRVLNINEMLKYKINVPSVEEQTKIGEYFDNLDNLITFHQRKCDGLKNTKKFMLQKMFPKNGEQFPEIRFSGFTDAWEQRKLGEMYVERNEKGNDNLQILSVSIHSGVSDKELDEENLGKFVRRSEDKSKYKHVYTGDLIFNMMRAWQGAIGVAKSEGMISPAYISAIPNEDVYPLFMDYAMRRKEAIEEINNLSYGITDFRKRLYWDSFVHVTCQLPSVEEQEKIYKYFKTLDNLITFHQRKSDQLKMFKKFMLQNMFP